MSYTSRDIARSMHYAGFWLEEIKDVMPKILNELPKHIGTDHAFFDMKSGIEKFANENGLNTEEAAPLFLDQIETIIKSHEYPEPPPLQPVVFAEEDEDFLLENVPEELVEIAESVLAVYEATGKRPVSGSCMPFTHGPLAGQMTPAAAFVRIRNYAAQNPGCGFSTYAGFLNYFEIGEAPKTGRPSPLSASSLFNAVASHIEEGHDLDLLKDDDFRIAGMKVKSINQSFRRAGIDGLSAYMKADAEDPKTLHAFAQVIDLNL